MLYCSQDTECEADVITQQREALLSSCLLLIEMCSFPVYHTSTNASTGEYVPNSNSVRADNPGGEWEISRPARYNRFRC